MYGLVLMSVMAATPDTPQFHGFFRNLFSRGDGCPGAAARPGCLGGCAGSMYPAACYGSCAGSMYPAACYGSGAGCEGGGLFERIRRFFGRNGCNGTAYSMGCQGVAYQCYGGLPMAYSPYAYSPYMSGGTGCCGGLAPLAPPAVETIPGPPAPPPSIPYAPPEAAPPPPGSAAVPGTGAAAGGRGLRRATAPSSSPAIAPAAAAGVVPGVAPAALAGSLQRATIVVHLPAEARLYAEERLLRQSGPVRTFVTPLLPAGQEFTYRFKIEFDRDQETVAVTRTVKVRAGQQQTVAFVDPLRKSDAATDNTTGRPADRSTDRSIDRPADPPAGERPTPPVAGTPRRAPDAAAAPSGERPPAAETAEPPIARQAHSLTATRTAAVAPLPAVPPPAPFAPAATARATLIVKLPPQARLYVNERPLAPSPQTVRQFQTPPLPTHQEFAYLLRVEIDRPGGPETLTQRVAFRAGERVEVDFAGSLRP